MKMMTCKQLGGPCDISHEGATADEIIKAQDAHLKEMATGGSSPHDAAFQQMKGRWKNPLKGMSWYKQVKRDFANLPES